MSSLKSIAADIGVSHVLVSRVLNNRMGTTRVSEKTREAILRRAQELDYQPNPLALALKQGRRGVIGLFVHGVGAPGSDLNVDFILSATQKASDMRMNLWLQFFEHDDEFISACNSKLLRKIDGLIVAGISHPQLTKKLNEMESQGLPVVSACHKDPEVRDFVNFQVDATAQCYLTTAHLIEIGCRRIAHFNVGASWPFRQQGYEKAHLEMGLLVDKRLIFPSKNYNAKAGYESMALLVESGETFDGLVAQSDAQAVGALHYLLERGWPRERWPKITGVDNSPIAQFYSPVPLTSVTAEMATCARLALGALEQKFKREPVESHLVPPQLVIRQSTVP